MPEPKKLDESINDDLSSKKEEETKAVVSKLTGGASLKKAPTIQKNTEVDVEAIRKAIAGNY